MTNTLLWSAWAAFVLTWGASKVLTTRARAGNSHRYCAATAALDAALFVLSISGVGAGLVGALRGDWFRFAAVAAAYICLSAAGSVAGQTIALRYETPKAK